MKFKINKLETEKVLRTIAHEYVQEYDETENIITPKYFLEGSDDEILHNLIRVKNININWMEDKDSSENTLKTHLYKKKLFDKEKKYLKFSRENFSICEIK